MAFTDPSARRMVAQFLTEHERALAKAPAEKRQALFQSPAYREYMREHRKLLADLRA